MRFSLLVLLLALPCAAQHKLVYFGEAPDQAIATAMSEVEKQARFLGIEYHSEVREQIPEVPPADAHAVFVSGSPQEILDLAAALEPHGAPVFNLHLTADALRKQCRKNLFHISPSDAMLADAVRQWREAHPEPADVEARAWHPDFYKFAARELNNRWRAQTGRAMTDADWAIWAAYRLVGDAIANNPDASPSELVDYLRNEMEFDGQKGAFLTFRPTGQLRQPLLIVVDGELAGEAPVRGVAPVDDLDSLGLQTCER